MNNYTFPQIIRVPFIFNVRVNPDNTDDGVSIRHPKGKIIISIYFNNNFGINIQVSV